MCATTRSTATCARWATCSGSWRGSAATTGCARGTSSSFGGPDGRPTEDRPVNVVVVGAGPVGLTAALALRSLDVPVTVVEAGAQDRIRPGSRAIFIHGASMQLLEGLSPGLGHQLADHGLIWLTKRTLYRGQEIYARTYRPPKPDVLPAA